MHNRKDAQSSLAQEIGDVRWSTWILIETVIDRIGMTHATALRHTYI